jgi:2,4-dienoyl-CoA reductase-like NADH-dependent reductase (Old Yellow Enzyme family)
MLCSFLDADNNRRTDSYGGSFGNRCRILFELVEGIRAATGPDFQLGMRISPERFGIPLAEARELARRLLATGRLDYLDLSLWDVFKEPADQGFAGTRLIDHFVDLPRNGTALGVAGKIGSAAAAQACLDSGADFVLIGRGAILHHDFPRLAMADPGFAARPLPVGAATLAAEGLSAKFIGYMGKWQGFVTG